MLCTCTCITIKISNVKALGARPVGLPYSKFNNNKKKKKNLNFYEYYRIFVSEETKIIRK